MNYFIITSLVFVLSFASVAPSYAMKSTMENDMPETLKAKDMKMKESTHADLTKKAKAKYDAALKTAQIAYAKAIQKKGNTKKAKADLEKAKVAAKKIFKQEVDAAMKAEKKKGVK